jgi:hypothetical protein
MARSAKLRAALRNLANPYASLQFEENAGALDNSPRALWKRSENPYAQEFFLEEGGGQSPRARPSATPGAAALNQADFEQRACAIFRPYIPAEEHGRLRPHYREFIERNKARSPEMRFKLIGELRRYDLSDLHGLSPKFNRELEGFTKEKLLEIEAKAESKADDQKT